MTQGITAVRICAQADIEKTGCYALLYVQGGSMVLCVGEEELSLETGSVCLLAHADMPRVQAHTAAEGVLVCIPASLAAVSALSPLFLHFANGARVETLDAQKMAFFDTVMGDILKITPETPFAAQQMLARTVDLLTALPLPIAPTHATARDRITAAVMRYVEENIARAISLDDIAAALFVSKYHMCHVFKEEAGISVGEAVLRRKVAHARRLLEAGVPAHRVSEMVGFNHYSAFFRIFKRITGRAPTGKR